MKRVLVAVSCALLLTACGDDDDGDNPQVAITSVVSELQDASRAGDGQRICDELFTQNLAISIKRASGQSCGDEVKDNVAAKDATFKVEKLTVNGDNAEGELLDQSGQRSAVLFQREDGSWRIARIAGVGS